MKINMEYRHNKRLHPDINIDIPCHIMGDTCYILYVVTPGVWTHIVEFITIKDQD